MKHAVLALAFLFACSTSRPTIQDDAEPEALQALVDSAVEVEVDHIVSRGSGSGVILRVDATGTWVLTAAHVCMPDLAEARFLALIGKTTVIKVSNYAGESASAYVVRADEEEDLCLLYADAPMGKATLIGDKMPPIGAQVWYAGSPLGLAEKGAVIVDSGRYSGMSTKHNKALYAGITYMGASGSGIMYQGKLIGILQAVRTRWGYIWFGSDAAAINKFLNATI